MGDLVRSSPLGCFRDRAAFFVQCAGDVRIEERPFLSKLRIQLLPGAVRGWEGWRLSSNQTLGEDPLVLWTGPFERLVVSFSLSCEVLAQVLGPTVIDSGALVTDVTHGVTVLRVSGAGAPSALAADIALDLDGSELGPGRCAQTLLAQGRVLVHRLPYSAGAWDVYVDRSLARFTAEWLVRCAGAAPGTGQQPSALPSLAG